MLKFHFNCKLQMVKCWLLISGRAISQRSIRAVTWKMLKWPRLFKITRQSKNPPRARKQKMKSTSLRHRLLRLQWRYQKRRTHQKLLNLSYLIKPNLVQRPFQRKQIPQKPMLTLVHVQQVRTLLHLRVNHRKQNELLQELTNAPTKVVISPILRARIWKLTRERIRAKNRICVTGKTAAGGLRALTNSLDIIESTRGSSHSNVPLVIEVSLDRTTCPYTWNDIIREYYSIITNQKTTAGGLFVVMNKLESIEASTN